MMIVHFPMAFLMGSAAFDVAAAVGLAVPTVVNVNRSAEYVHYDHCIIRTRSFHIEERNRTIQ